MKMHERDRRIRIRWTVCLSAVFVWCATASAGETGSTATITLHPAQEGPRISRDIFGQFAEQLGTGIYGGIWVGEDSNIPNIRGIRTDVVKELQALRVPNVRWPGGCYAEQYNWRNGVGPADRRVTTLNTNWGNALDPNSFGTKEFMDFLQQIGSEAYLTVNVATGSPEGAASWLEYLTTDQPTTLGKQRADDGHPTPYRVKYLGIGNESWGCGGAMSSAAYVDRLKIYSMFVRNLNPEQSGPSRFQRSPSAMQRIAVGPADTDTEWTEAVMKAWQHSDPYRWSIEGLSLHHYTMGELGLMRDPATGFGEQEYATFVKNTLEMEQLISKHSAIMDKYDPEKKVTLAVDEWGVWLAPMPDANPLFLRQQNSLRDAILASLNLNTFARHADRVRLANIAQMVNVLQSMILTDKDRMVLTPTYFVYRMYAPFQDALRLPIDVDAGVYKFGAGTVPRIDAIAARSKDGSVWLAATNIDPNSPTEIVVATSVNRAVVASGEVLTGARVDSINTFDDPAAVGPHPLTVNVHNGQLTFQLPPKSIGVVHWKS